MFAIFVKKSSKQYLNRRGVVVYLWLKKGVKS